MSFTKINKRDEFKNFNKFDEFMKFDEQNEHCIIEKIYNRTKIFYEFLCLIFFFFINFYKHFQYNYIFIIILQVSSILSRCIRTFLNISINQNSIYLDLSVIFFFHFLNQSCNYLKNVVVACGMGRFLPDPVAKRTEPN